ncbi:MAG: methylated-DNA--[protein]-cysteine S-methyltransferase [Phycisphaerae bacterium]|nr:methylated-DNA--[protein]-cysteine S-methyltransferase [Phycisphaerae bacterium]
MSLAYRTLETPMGFAGVVAGAAGLRRVYLPEASEPALLRKIHADEPEAVENARLLPELADALRRYFAGKPVTFEVELDIGEFTAFQQAALRACAAVGYGETATYGELAERIGHAGAARAVGSSMARNRIPIVIPCHRIIGANNGMCGFSGPGGVASKEALLRMERAATASAMESPRRTRTQKLVAV